MAFNMSNTLSILFFLWLGVSYTYGYGSNGCQDIDDLLSDVYRLGDTQRLWPEEDEEFQQYC
ncbi:unnamed protein product, partial [Medioppia subpectinata]